MEDVGKAAYPISNGANHDIKPDTFNNWVKRLRQRL